MEIVLQRLYKGEDCVIGTLSADRKVLCYTLENPEKDNKEDISCIPAGKYNCVPYSSKKYPDVWKILNVPGRTDILIHVGNYERNTKGCVLVGSNVGYNKEKMVTNSSITMKKLHSDIGVSRSFTLVIKDI
jgi:hypothetical protein